MENIFQFFENFSLSRAIQLLQSPFVLPQIQEIQNMKTSEIELPSNKNFGFFFTIVFVIVAAYLFRSGPSFWSHIFAVISFGFLALTLINADLLLPLNKLWMRFGILLSLIVGPIVLGLIFYGLFTPIAFFMRLSGRDELRLKYEKKPSYWISRNEPIKSGSFKLQF